MTRLNTQKRDCWNNRNCNQWMSTYLSHRWDMWTSINITLLCTIHISDLDWNSEWIIAKLGKIHAQLAYTDVLNPPNPKIPMATNLADHEIYAWSDFFEAENSITAISCRSCFCRFLVTEQTRNFAAIHNPKTRVHKTNFVHYFSIYKIDKMNLVYRNKTWVRPVAMIDVLGSQFRYCRYLCPISV